MSKSKRKSYYESLSPKMKQFFFDSVNEALKILNLNDYSVQIRWMKENDEGSLREGNDLLASIHVDKRYLKATIAVFPCLVTKWSDKKNGKEDIKHALFHEVAHIATQHFFDVATSIYKDEGETKDAWETCTERIAQLTLKVSSLSSK